MNRKITTEKQPVVPPKKSMNNQNDNPVDPEGPVFVVSTSCEKDFGMKPPRKLESIRSDRKRQQREMRRRQQELELDREAELRRQMIARQKEWE